jgi:uncharacterized lipoprotein YehR (DUF1307 family)
MVLNGDRMNTVYKTKDEIVTREIAGETILVPVKGKLADMQKIFSLNPVAEYIWQQLNGDKSITEIRDSIIESFDVDREQAGRDILDLINSLLKEDLIVQVK